MMARRIATGAALVGGVAWLVKVALIWGNGGTNLDEGVVGAMYLVGALSLLVASAASGAALLGGRPSWLRAVAAAAGIAVFILGSSLLDALLSPLAAEGSWQREEVAIVTMAVIALAGAAVGLVGLGRGSRMDTAAA